MGARSAPSALQASAFRAVAATTLKAAAVPALLAVVLVVPSIVWVGIDRSIWPWDPAWYGEVSIGLWATLSSEPSAWHWAMIHAFGLKPPAVAWLGQFFVPLGGVTGSDQVALLLSVVLAQAASLALLYVAARRLTGGRTLPVLAGVLLLAGGPLFVALSHEYFVEPLQTFSVVWVLFIMVSASRWHPSLTVAQLVAAASLGLLTKVTTPVYMLPPALLALGLSIVARRKREWPMWWRETRFLASAILALLLGLATLDWYRLNLSQALEHGRFSANSELYGRGRGFFSGLGFWIGRLGDALFLPYFDLAVAALVLGGLTLLVVRGRGLALRLARQRLAAAVAGIAATVVLLAILASQVNEEDRFLLPLAACLALALAAILDVLGSRLVAALAVAALGAQFLLVSLQSFDVSPSRRLAYSRLVEPVGESAFAAELERVVRLTCTDRTIGRINMIGTDYPWLNANTMEMLAFARFAESGRRCYYTGLGFAARDPNAAWQRLREFKSPFYISVDFGNRRNPLPRELLRQTSLSNAFNRVNVAVLRRAIRSGTYVVVPGTRRLGLVVLRSTAR